MKFTCGEQKHEAKSCPRCGSSFVCKPADIANCQCHSVDLLPATLAFLRKTEYGCLCACCLVEINQMVKRTLQDGFPKTAGELREGVHFYWENGKVVFTEYYHLLRGFCCRSGCRHCAYGYWQKAAAIT